MTFPSRSLARRRSSRTARCCSSALPCDDRTRPTVHSDGDGLYGGSVTTASPPLPVTICSGHQGRTLWRRRGQRTPSTAARAYDDITIALATLRTGQHRPDRSTAGLRRQHPAGGQGSDTITGGTGAVPHQRQPEQRDRRNRSPHRRRRQRRHPRRGQQRPHHATASTEGQNISLDGGTGNDHPERDRRHSVMVGGDGEDSITRTPRRPCSARRPASPATPATTRS